MACLHKDLYDWILKHSNCWYDFCHLNPDGSLKLKGGADIPSPATVQPNPWGNITFNPRLVHFAVENFSNKNDIIFTGFAEFAMKELKKFLDSRSRTTESNYRHFLFTNFRECWMSQDIRNTTETKTVVTPLQAGDFGLSIKLQKFLSKVLSTPNPREDLYGVAKAHDVVAIEADPGVVTVTAVEQEEGPRDDEDDEVMESADAESSAMAEPQTTDPASAEMVVEVEADSGKSPVEEDAEQEDMPPIGTIIATEDTTTAEGVLKKLILVFDSTNENKEFAEKSTQLTEDALAVLYSPQNQDACTS